MAHFRHTGCHQVPNSRNHNHCHSYNRRRTHNHTQNPAGNHPNMVGSSDQGNT
jgi:hypothetical protein